MHVCETLSYKLESQLLPPIRICAHGIAIVPRVCGGPNLTFGKKPCVLSKPQRVPKV